MFHSKVSIHKRHYKRDQTSTRFCRQIIEKQSMSAFLQVLSISKKLENCYYEQPYFLQVLLDCLLHHQDPKNIFKMHFKDTFNLENILELENHLSKSTT